MARLDVTIITMRDKTIHEVKNGSVLHPNVTFNTLGFEKPNGFKAEIKLALSIRTAIING